MEIKKASFITGAASVEGYLAAAARYDCPEICFVGRSNVGKSSFINMLTGNGKLAKTSSTPGRTRLINLFGVGDGDFVMVDLPGYGYAAASKGEQRGWGAMIEGYLRSTTKLAQAFLLLDCRHEPSALDKQMINYFHYYATPFTIVATKCDKLSKAQLGRAVTALSSATALGRDNILCVSYSGMGRERVLERIETLLERTD